MKNIVASTGDEWLWGWDPTPGIVSVWAERDGRATIWRRIVETGALVREDARFRPWVLLDRLDDLAHLGARFGRDGSAARKHTKLWRPAISSAASCIFETSSGCLIHHTNRLESAVLRVEI